MKFGAKIKARGRRDTAQFSTKQAAIDWARDREADHVTITESIDGGAKRVVFSGRPG